MHRLVNPAESPRKLTQSVLQITEMLGLYQAELARVLGVQCSDIGRMSSGQEMLKVDSPAWGQALWLIRFYEGLYQKTGGDGVAMCHWLRADNLPLGGIPLLLMVDDGRLQDVVGCLESETH